MSKTKRPSKRTTVRAALPSPCTPASCAGRAFFSLPLLSLDDLSIPTNRFTRLLQRGNANG